MNLSDIAALSPERLDRAFLADAFERMPGRWARPVAKTYSSNYKKHGRRAANLAVLDTLESVEGFRFNVARSDDELREFAKARVDECWRAAARYKDADAALVAMRQIAARYGIEPPAGRNVTPTSERARLLCDCWWRRRIRKVAGRAVEAAAVKVGLVHRYAGLYVSDESLARRIGQKARNRAILESTVAVNSDGDELTLQEISDKGVSNPEKRRMELMTRLAGFDLVAVDKGHAAEFYTITCPSKYHARDSKNGRENPKYQGATPRDAQDYLCKQWSKIRSALQRAGIRIYGFRVAEPHHDGCPHWHMVMFMEQAHVKSVRAILRKYALEVDGNEPGAAKRRFEAKKIDRSKGNAAAYLAKYIAKNIDGYGVGEDWEAVEGQDDATTSAQRVDAWASTWGIRQFQQIGGAGVSIWRELRRLDLKQQEIENELLREVAAAADAGEWARYTQLQGGPFVKRADQAVTVWKLGALDIETGEIRLNKYGEFAADKTKGVQCDAEQIETRIREWVIERRGAAVTPWSSVNNCTPPESQIQVDREFEEKIAEKSGQPDFCSVDLKWRGADEYKNIIAAIGKPAAVSATGRAIAAGSSGGDE